MKIRILYNPDNGNILMTTRESDFGTKSIQTSISYISISIDDEPENETIIKELINGGAGYTVSGGELLKDAVPVTLAENPYKAIIRQKYLDSMSSIETMKTIDLSINTVARITAIIQGTSDPDRPGIAEILEFILQYLKYVQINNS